MMPSPLRHHHHQSPSSYCYLPTYLPTTVTDQLLDDRYSYCYVARMPRPPRRRHRHRHAAAEFIVAPSRSSCCYLLVTVLLLVTINCPSYLLRHRRPRHSVNHFHCHRYAVTTHSIVVVADVDRRRSSSQFRRRPYCLERANAAIYPTVGRPPAGRLSGARCRRRAHVRWVLADDEDAALDARSSPALRRRCPHPGRGHQVRRHVPGARPAVPVSGPAGGVPAGRLGGPGRRRSPSRTPTRSGRAPSRWTPPAAGPPARACSAASSPSAESPSSRRPRGAFAPARNLSRPPAPPSVRWSGRRPACRSLSSLRLPSGLLCWASCPLPAGPGARCGQSGSRDAAGQAHAARPAPAGAQLGAG